MSMPEWKRKQMEKEQREKEKKAAEEAAKREAFAALEQKKKALDAERARKDAEDEKQIEALLEERKRTGIGDTKVAALAKANAQRAAEDVKCDACGLSLVDGGAFVKLAGKQLHRKCLVCAECGVAQKPGIQVEDGRLCCYDCRQARLTAPTTGARFCANCSEARVGAEAACRKCMRPFL